MESQRAQDMPLRSTVLTATVALVSCSGQQLLAMKFLVLLTMSVAVTQANSALPVAEENSCSGLKNDRSLLSSLLTVAGYNDTCVAAALDSCRTGQEVNRYASLVEDAREVVQQVSVAVNKWESRPRHCKDLLDSGDSGSGLRQVYPFPGQPHHRVTVFCDNTVDGGGWTVFQRRTSDTVRQDFFRTWIEYQLGFGDLEGEFWLGLDLLHQLTSTTLQELRIDLHDYEGEHRWAKYGFFHVGTPATKFRLSVGSGDAGDGLSGKSGQAFSTHDADNDAWDDNCAKKYRGAYWYTACHSSNLNGYQYVGNHTTYADGINWYNWRGHHYSLKRTSMKIRPTF
ncbi:microfibril-associated glycoprotein 4-like isoform X2 [Portunus trituberculatus]|uniref:microfibril-associated glycoprotein 4-like isoform X2 n=1 Tax=Portunus trituberculatus TaxID=210409 RepID=UPI001E1CBD4B|nr:microfibril-associated glycoprotein 4-like isoform X2 [Portunus trituberculatus]